MFERFTEDARRCLFFSRVIAAERRHEAIASDDLLRAMVNEAGFGNRVPLHWHDSLESDRREGETVEERMKRISAADWFRDRARETPLASGVKRALQHGAEEADALNHDAIRPLHLLLGLLSEEGTEAQRMLLEAGVTLEDVRRELADQA